ncbi:hypothetical protein [Streptomyces sp. NPDC087294]|uniref:hypothetical protein n=1 Tax=Streptomyces sp. NPDC087294 TaxID=3365777 RepID=UPI00382C44C3
MTTTIMTRDAARPTRAAFNPEYACQKCGTWHKGACPTAAPRDLGDLWVCPVCRLIFEACTCTGYEDNETDHHGLVRRLVADGDKRAADAGRRARRTLAEMAPGYTRQPVLVLHRPVMVSDPCPLCERWTCDPANCPPSGASVPPAVAPATGAGEGQCSMCGTWYPGWNGGVCANCR